MCKEKKNINVIKKLIYKMTWTQKFKNLFKGDYSFKDIVDYFRGSLRYEIYCSTHFQFLMRKHILDQITFRIIHMDSECYAQGSCKLCGCATIALQMSNKSCGGTCYPPMMNKRRWKCFSKGNKIYDSKNNIYWKLRNGTLVKLLS